MIYRQPIDLELGVDFASPDFALYQADGYSPLNLAGYAARLMLRYLATDPSPAVSLTEAASSLGQVVLGGLVAVAPNPGSGLVAFRIAPAGLARLIDRAGVYALFLTAPNSGPTLYVAGGTWSLARPAAS